MIYAELITACIPFTPKEIESELFVRGKEGKDCQTAFFPVHLTGRDVWQAIRKIPAKQQNAILI
jgi:hypothetical protein